MRHVWKLPGDLGAQAAPRDQRIAALALRQHGRVAHGQLEALGLTEGAIQKRLTSGRLHAVHRGVYAVGHAAPTPAGHWMAAVLAGGPGTLLSHRSGSVLYGVLDGFAYIIDVVNVRRRTNRDGIVFHRTRTLHPEDVTEVDGIPVTSVARTLLDLAEVLPRRRLLYAIDRAEQLRLLDLNGLERVMRRGHGRRGLKPLTAALAEMHLEAQYTHQGLERDFLSFCLDYGVTVPAFNVVVERFTVDALWREHKLIVELDSWDRHSGRRAFEDDRLRDEVLTVAGYTTMRITRRRLVKDPDGLARTLRALTAPPSPAPTP